MKGDHALRCSGKMGTKMRHDALKVLLARAFKQAGFTVKMEQGGGLLDRRRPGDVEVEDWLVVDNWKDNTSLSIDVAIIDPLGDNHSATLRSYGVGGAATKYEDRKRKTYWDIKNNFSPFVLEASGGFGTEAKRLVRELERKRKEKECRPNMRSTQGFQTLGDINLVTAIGFELVRRNVRMIIDRSPEDEPLIPEERTKIRMEISSNKASAKLSNEEAYETGYPGDTEMNKFMDKEHTMVGGHDQSRQSGGIDFEMRRESLTLENSQDIDQCKFISRIEPSRSCKQDLTEIKIDDSMSTTNSIRPHISRLEIP